MSSTQQNPQIPSNPKDLLIAWHDLFHYLRAKWDRIVEEADGDIYQVVPTRDGFWLSMDHVDQMKAGQLELVLLPPQQWCADRAFLSSDPDKAWLLDTYYECHQQGRNRAGSGSGCDYTITMTPRFIEWVADYEFEEEDEENSILVEVGGACDLPGGGLGLVVNDGQGLLLPPGLSEEEVQALFATLQQQQDQDTGLGLSDRVRGGSEVVKQLDVAFANVWEFAEGGWGSKAVVHHMSHQFIFFAERYSQEVETLPIEFSDWREIGKRRQKGWLSDGSPEVDGTFEGQAEGQDTGLGLSDRVRGGSEEEDEPGSPGTHMFEQMLGQLSEDCADWARKFDAQKARADALQRSIDMADAALQAAIDAEVDKVEADTGLPIDAPVGVWLDAEHKCLHYFVYGMSKGDRDAVFEFFDKEPWCYMSRTTCDGSCCEFCRGKQSFQDHIAKYSNQPPPAEAPAPTSSDEEHRLFIQSLKFEETRNLWFQFLKQEGRGHVVAEVGGYLEAGYPMHEALDCDGMDRALADGLHKEFEDWLGFRPPSQYEEKPVCLTTWVEFEGFQMCDETGRLRYQSGTAEDAARLERFRATQAQAEDQDTGLGLSDRVRGGSEVDVVEWVEFEGVEMSVSDGRQRYQEATAEDAARLERFEDELIERQIDFVCDVLTEDVNRRNRWFDFLRHRGMSYAVADVEQARMNGDDILDALHVESHFGAVWDLLVTFEAIEGQD